MGHRGAAAWLFKGVLYLSRSILRDIKSVGYALRPRVTNGPNIKGCVPNIWVSSFLSFKLLLVGFGVQGLWGTGRP